MRLSKWHLPRTALLMCSGSLGVLRLLTKAAPLQLSSQALGLGAVPPPPPSGAGLDGAKSESVGSRARRSHIEGYPPPISNPRKANGGSPLLLTFTNAHRL